MGVVQGQTHSQGPGQAAVQLSVSAEVMVTVLHTASTRARARAGRDLTCGRPPAEGAGSGPERGPTEPSADCWGPLPHTAAPEDSHSGGEGTVLQTNTLADAHKLPHTCTWTCRESTARAFSAALTTFSTCSPSCRDASVHHAAQARRWGRGSPL